MADTKISELSSATNLADTDIIVGVNAGTTRKFTLQRIRDFFAKTFDGNYAEKEHEHNKLYNNVYYLNMPTGMKKNETIATTSDLTAEKITYNNSDSQLMAEDVQDAIDELKTVSDAQAKTLAETAELAEAALPAEDVGKAGGAAGLGADGKVPKTQLPTYVSRVEVSVVKMSVKITVS